MNFFGALAVAAIILGGVVSAFSAKRPSRFAMWATAYLVLVVGIIQIGLLMTWGLLEIPASALEVIAFSLFNLGNIAVIVGRWQKGTKPYARYVVYAGGALLAVSMIMLGLASLSAEPSWGHSLFFALVLIILVSMPIGLSLSARPHKATH